MNMNQDFLDVLIIIPAYNEESQVKTIIENLMISGFKNIVVIDDGSKDQTCEEVLKTKAMLLKHPINIGLGGALSTGLEYARQHGFQYAITIDSDGQHDIADAKKIAKELKKNKYDFVIGSRLKSMKNKNNIRFFGNHLMDFTTAILSGKYIEDTQSGLRAFNKIALSKIQPISSGYEVSSEIIIQAVKGNLKISTIPIKAIYTDYSLKKGQKISNAIRVIRRLVVR